MFYNLFVIWDLGYKYFISYEDFNGILYFVYLNGLFYIMFKKVVFEFFNVFKNICLFKMEDVYLGVLVKYLGIVFI